MVAKIRNALMLQLIKNITELYSYDSHSILQLPIQGGNPMYLPADCNIN